MKNKSKLLLKQPSHYHLKIYKYNVFRYNGDWKMKVKHLIPTPSDEEFEELKKICPYLYLDKEFYNFYISKTGLICVGYSDISYECGFTIDLDKKTYDLAYDWLGF